MSDPLSGSLHPTTCLSNGVCGILTGEYLIQSWDTTMVTLSWIVSVMGAFTTMRTVAHLKFCGDRTWYWIFVVVSGMSFGLLSVWSMHFVGMQALRLEARDVNGAHVEVQIEFTPALTIASSLAAWFIASFGIAIVSGRKVERRQKKDKELIVRILVAAIFVACGAWTMHYMGMYSMHGPFEMSWDGGVVLLSFLIAYIAAAAGLAIIMMFPARAFAHILASIAIGSAVSAMHYTGMTAAHYIMVDTERSFSGMDGLDIPGMTIVVASMIANLVLSVPLQHYGEEQRVRYEVQIHEAHARELQMNIEMAATIAGSLVNYDLEQAENLISDKDYKQIAVLSPLAMLLRNLTVYRAFLPHALFEKQAAADPPNEVLARELQACETSTKDIEQAVDRLRDPGYTLLEFHEHMIRAYPELKLYLASETCNSGHSGHEEYQRTLGALYTLFAFMRLDIDGKQLMSFGVDAEGHPMQAPATDDPLASKKQAFFRSMDWDKLQELMTRSGIMATAQTGELKLVHERAVAMLTLTAIHDIMKNSALLPKVQSAHVPFHGYVEGDQITDHDLALAYILEYYPAMLPSFKYLTPAQRAPVLFTQAKMNFNNGWLVQGEAPPGALFRSFKEAISQGRASKSDVSFYFVHWITDLAGADPYGEKAWPGAEKLTAKLPTHVLVAFLNSFKYVEHLANASEVQVMESYLHSRMTELQISTQRPGLENCRIAAMRLVLMAQGFEQEVVDALTDLASLHPEDVQVLGDELAQTSCKEQFMDCPVRLAQGVKGPALLVYYAPALIQKAGEGEGIAALTILAAVLRAAREIFPLDARFQDQTCTVRIDALKSLSPNEIISRQPWILQKTGSTTAEAACGDLVKNASQSRALGLSTEFASIDLPVVLPKCV